MCRQNKILMLFKLFFLVHLWILDTNETVINITDKINLNVNKYIFYIICIPL